MKIVDNRDKENDLSTFRNIPNLCVFEFPDIGGLYIKFDENEVYELSDSVEYVSVPPEKEVRALDTELHINGVKKF